MKSTCTNATEGEPGESLTMAKIVALMEQMPRYRGFILLSASRFVDATYRLPAPYGCKALYWVVAPKHEVDGLIAEFGALRPSLDMPHSYEVNVFDPPLSDERQGRR